MKCVARHHGDRFHAARRSSEIVAALGIATYAGKPIDHNIGGYRSDNHAEAKRRVVGGFTTRRKCADIREKRAIIEK